MTSSSAAVVAAFVVLVDVSAATLPLLLFLLRRLFR